MVPGILGWEEAPVLWGSPSPQSSPRGRGSCLSTTLLDSGPVSGYGVCFRRKDEVGSLCGRRWWYRMVGVLSRDVSAWIPAPYQRGRLFAGMTNSGGTELWLGTSESARRILPRPDPSGGRAPRLAKSSTALHSPHPHPLWIPAPYRGTGQALRWNDEMSGESLSRIGVREVLPCRYEAGPGLESILSWD